MRGKKTEKKWGGAEMESYSYRRGYIQYRSSPLRFTMYFTQWQNRYQGAMNFTVPFEGHRSESISRLTIIILLYERIQRHNKVTVLSKVVTFRIVRGRQLLGYCYNIYCYIGILNTVILWYFDTLTQWHCDTVIALNNNTTILW